MQEAKPGPVAQLVSAPPCHGGGRGFESRRGRRETLRTMWSGAFCVSRHASGGRRTSPYAVRGRTFPRVGLNGAMPVELDPAAFDALVERALDDIPDEIAALVRNVVVLVEDEPPADEPDLLGLYEGIALTERWGDGAMELPDRIFVFRGPLLDLCD